MNCSVAGCQNKSYCRQLCGPHYKRFWRYGDTFDKKKIKNVRLTLAERMPESFIISKSGCHEWAKAINKSGYGHYSNKTFSTSIAHRIVYQLKHGKITNGLFVLHKCDNRKCINIDHLFLGTAKDNTQDMISKDRQFNKKGIMPKGFILQIEKNRNKSKINESTRSAC